MPLSTGQILHNRYRIVKLLKQGGFGAVYRAWDTSLTRPCALKENLDTSSEAQRQFAREASILANLSHPNLPRVTDHFFIPGQGQYLVMDLVEGEDLETMLARLGGPLPEADAVKWIAQVCDALEYLHDQNPPVIHRDIKPANIKISPKGQAILVDFGIAKIYDPRLKTTLGARAVTPGYSPHEQYGQGTTDARSDIYALGATMYALLTGVEPPESIQRVAVDPLIPPEQLNPRLTPRLAAVIKKAMQMNPNQRCQSMQEFKAALAASPAAVTLNAPTQSSQPYTQAQPVAARAPLPRWLVPGALVAALLIMTIIAGRSITSNNRIRQTAAAIARVFTPSPSPSEAAPLLVSPSPLPPTDMSKSPTSTPTRPLQTSTPPIIATPPLVREKDGMVMVYVPAGEFLRGSTDSDPNAQSYEKPQRKITLDAFWIDKTEVTNGMYALCVKAGACQPPYSSSSNKRSAYYGNPEYANYPTIYVFWNDAKTYCEWAGARLPTEAEWEKAARGPDGRLYPWGDQPPDAGLLNYKQNIGDTTEVGSYPDGASPYGALDMAGNVWEWVADWYDGNYYTSSPAENPKGPDTGQYRVVRGGSWNFGAWDSRVADRYWSNPDYRGNSYGFRCVR